MGEFLVPVLAFLKLNSLEAVPTSLEAPRQSCAVLLSFAFVADQLIAPGYLLFFVRHVLCCDCCVSVMMTC